MWASDLTSWISNIFSYKELITMMRKDHDSVSGKHVIIVAFTLLVMTFLTSYQNKKHDNKKDTGMYVYAHDKLQKENTTHR